MTPVTMTAAELAEYTQRCLNAALVIFAETLELKQIEIDRLFRRTVEARNQKRAELVKSKTRKKGAK